MSTNELIVDASTLINLLDGVVIQSTIAVPACNSMFGPMVYRELGDRQEEVEQLVSKGLLEQLSGDEISGSEFLSFQSIHNIGPGETECILYARYLDSRMATDDARARRVSEEHLGKSKVIGSIGLMRQAVERGKLTDTEAFRAYNRMIDAGAFLPRVSGPDYFSDQH